MLKTIFSQSTLTTLPLFVVAAAACFFSGWLTLQLIQSLQPGVMAAGFGITLHAMQYALAAAVKTRRAFFITKALTTILIIALLGLSVCATVAFMETGYQNTATQSQTQARNQTRADLLDQTASKRLQIATRLASIKHSSDAGTQLDALERSVIHAAKLDTPAPNTALFASIQLIATATGATHTQIRLIAFTLLGLFLDCGGFLALLYLLKPLQQHRVSPVAPPAIVKPVESLQETIMNQVKRGHFGPAPTVKTIHEKTGISKATVSRALTRYAQEQPA